MRNFRVWVAYQLYEWLRGHIRPAVIQIIIATVVELGNISIFSSSVYPAINLPQITGWISGLYMIDASLTLVFFILVVVSWIYNRSYSI